MEQIESQIDHLFSKYNINDIHFYKKDSSFGRACMSILAKLVVWVCSQHMLVCVCVCCSCEEQAVATAWVSLMPTCVRWFLLTAVDKWD